MHARTHTHTHTHTHARTHACTHTHTHTHTHTYIHTHTHAHTHTHTHTVLGGWPEPQVHCGPGTNGAHVHRFLADGVGTEYLHHPHGHQ